MLAHLSALVHVDFNVNEASEAQFQLILARKAKLEYDGGSAQKHIPEDVT